MVYGCFVADMTDTSVRLGYSLTKLKIHEVLHTRGTVYLVVAVVVVVRIIPPSSADQLIGKLQ